MRTPLIFLILWIAVTINLIAGDVPHSSVNSNRLVKVAPDIQAMVDSWPKGVPTNGLVCAISFAPLSKGGSSVFYVNIINTTTNFLPGYLRVPFRGSAEISLFDLAGEQVEKTAAGKEVAVWTQAGVEKWFAEQLPKPEAMVKSGSVASVLFPLLYDQYSEGIRVCQLFNIDRPGEYTLHLHMRVVFSKRDKSGKIAFDSFFLPEVVAKIQIRTDDLTRDSTASKIQTKTPTR